MIRLPWQGAVALALLAALDCGGKTDDGAAANPTRSGPNAPDASTSKELDASVGSPETGGLGGRVGRGGVPSAGGGGGGAYSNIGSGGSPGGSGSGGTTGHVAADGAAGSADFVLELHGGSCAKAAPPVCNSNNFPYCAPDWATALDWYPLCPDPKYHPPYLARCGDLNAIIVPDAYMWRIYFYGPHGTLVGFDGASGEEQHCESFDSAFSLRAASCVPLVTGCADAGFAPKPPSLVGIDAGSFIDWDGAPPDCKTGQAAYDAYLASQLAQYNTCADDIFCQVTGDFGGLGPSNPCTEPCNLVLSIAAINSQIVSRLNAFGSVACARCGPAPETCSPGPLQGRCVNGLCAQSGP